MPRFIALLVLLFSAPVMAGPLDPEALEALPGADVVLLGEVHDNPAHHANQARAVAAISPRAIIFEMLTPDQAARVTDANRTDAAMLAEALGWAESGWPDFALYHPIITAAPDAAILGGALPRETVRRVFEGSAAEVFGPEAARYGLDRALPEAEQAAREAEQMAAHCDALPEAMLPDMVAAQRLRDAAMARAVVQAAEAGLLPVVVITGNGHARRDRGVPVYLAAAVPGLSVLSLGQFEAAPATSPPFDVWVLTNPAERPDPCLAFRTGGG